MPRSHSFFVPTTLDNAKKKLNKSNMNKRKKCSLPQLRARLQGLARPRTNKHTLDTQEPVYRDQLQHIYIDTFFSFLYFIFILMINCTASQEPVYRDYQQHTKKHCQVLSFEEVYNSDGIHSQYRSQSWTPRDSSSECPNIRSSELEHKVSTASDEKEKQPFVT